MKTIYQANKDLSNSFGRAGTVIPATLYIGLSISSTITQVGFTEPVGNGYARVALSNASGSFTTAANKSISTAVPVTFAPSSASWGTVHAIGIYDALTGGNLLYFEALTTPRAVDAETTLKFASGAITITEI